MNLRFTILDLGFERANAALGVFDIKRTFPPLTLALSPLRGEGNAPWRHVCRARYAMFTIISLMRLNGNGIFQSFIL
jgi:hypothetical protein